jgi:UDP-2,3-diacylglucosamine hydrolase
MNQDFSKLESNRKIYFASDFHLGVPTVLESKSRELKIVRWLDMAAIDAQAIFLVGDLFDFWFEYQQTVPKGYTRFLGKLAELSDRGIQIVVFSGNHDLWMQDYLKEEIGAVLYHNPQDFKIGEHEFYVAHGDGLGPGDRKYKFFKKVFANHLCQWLFQWLHPNLGVALAKYWSGHSRSAQEHEELVFYGEKERLIQYSRDIEQTTHYDFYIYGHRHIVSDYALSNNSRYINLGEWVYGSSYAVFDGKELSIQTFAIE